MKKTVLLSLVLVFILAACAPSAGGGEAVVAKSGIEIYDPWVRAAAMKEDTGEGMHGGGAVTGAFMLIKNTGSQADVLVSASSEVAADVQIHETSMQDGVMSMAEVPGIDIPAAGTAELQPGGYHIMLIGLKQELKAGDTVVITLVFKNAGEITVPVPVNMP